MVFKKPFSAIANILLLTTSLYALPPGTAFEQKYKLPQYTVTLRPMSFSVQETNSQTKWYEQKTTKQSSAGEEVPAVHVLKENEIRHFIEALPSDRKPKNNPALIIRISSESFDAITVVYGNAKDEENIISVGPVDLFEPKNDDEYRRNLREKLSLATVLAETQHKMHQGVSPMEGAYTVIVSKPGAAKEAVIMNLTESLIENGILGNRYIATMGRNMRLKDMALINTYAKKIKPKVPLPPAIDMRTEGDNVFPMSWSIYGISAAEALVAAINHPYIKKRLSAAKEKGGKFKVAIADYSYTAAAFVRVILQDYSKDIDIDIVGISDSGTVLLAENEMLPRSLFRYLKNRVLKGKKPYLKNVDSSFKGGVEVDTGYAEAAMFKAADIVILAGDSYSFDADRAKALNGKLVIEIGNNTVSWQARGYMNNPANNIILIPYSSANIGKAYVDREWLKNWAMQKPNYDTYTHMFLGITGIVLTNLWSVLDRYEGLSRVSEAESIESISEGFDSSAEKLTAVRTRQLKSVLMSESKGVIPVFAKFQMRQKQFSMPNTMPLAFKVAVFDQTYSDIIHLVGMHNIKQGLKSLSENERRIRVYLLGRMDYAPEEKRGIVQYLGALLGKEQSYYVKAEIIKAMGRIGHISALPYFIDILANSNPDKAGPKIWEWCMWAYERIKAESSEDKVEAILKKYKAEAKDEIEKADKALAIQKDQITYRSSAKAFYKLAVVYKLIDDKEKSIYFYQKALDQFKKAQAGGGLLPISIQINLSDIYFKMGSMDMARNMLLRLILLETAEEVIRGKLTTAQLPAAESHDIIRIYSKQIFKKLFVIDGLSEDAASDLASAIASYQDHYSLKAPPATLNDVSLRENEIIKDIEESMKEIFDLHIDDMNYRHYIILLVLFTTELYFRFPQITDAVLDVLSGYGVSENMIFPQHPKYIHLSGLLKKLRIVPDNAQTAYSRDPVNDLMFLKAINSAA